MLETTVTKERRAGRRKRQFHDVTVKGRSDAVRLTGGKTLSVAAETQDVSLRGLGLELSATPVWNKGNSVKIEMKIGLSRVELPARICWTDGRRMGVKVFLELLDQATRERYLRWVAS